MAISAKRWNDIAYRTTVFEEQARYKERDGQVVVRTDVALDRGSIIGLKKDDQASPSANPPQLLACKPNVSPLLLTVVENIVQANSRFLAPLVRCDRVYLAKHSSVSPDMICGPVDDYTLEENGGGQFVCLGENSEGLIYVTPMYLHTLYVDFGTGPSVDATVNSNLVGRSTTEGSTKQLSTSMNITNKTNESLSSSDRAYSHFVVGHGLICNHLYS